jgi:transcription antitermination factor NusG
MMNSLMPENWYVLKTKPFSEKKVYANLVKKECTVFLPLVQTIRQWSDRKKKMQVPLIPSVVFIKCTQRDLQLLYGEFGIVCVLQYLKKPAIVKEYEIDNLKILVTEFVGEEIVFEAVSIAPGQLVEVIQGPFKGMVAEAILSNGKHRIKVKIAALNTQCAINIPSSYVRAITKEVA